MLGVAGDQELGLCGDCALQDVIIIRIRTDLETESRLDNDAAVPQGWQEQFQFRLGPVELGSKSAGDLIHDRWGNI